MRPGKIAVVTGVSTAVLGAGWAAGLITAANNAPTLDAASGTTAPQTTDPATQAATATDATASASASADTSTSPSATATTEAAVSGTFDGAAVNTRYGAYQAEIVVEDGVITAVNVLQQGDNDRETKQINERAIPTLVERVLSAQSWNVEGVSGASYTSPALLNSVQDAMVQAGLA